MDDYLCHYGVIGMKWGVRRYQNADGTLTNAGKKRYQSDITKQDKQHVVNQIIELNSQGKNSIALDQKVRRLENDYYSICDKKEKLISNNKEYQVLQKQIQQNSKDDDYLESLSDEEFNKIVNENQRLMAESRQIYEKIASSSEYVRLQKQADRVYNEIEKASSSSSYNSALLKDLGYKDTESGRKFLEELYRSPIAWQLFE